MDWIEVIAYCLTELIIHCVGAASRFEDGRIDNTGSIDEDRAESAGDVRRPFVRSTPRSNACRKLQERPLVTRTLPNA
jgi:hypothetical protein